LIRKRTTITAAAARQTGRILKIATPRVFLPLLQSSARYKGAYGGRGSGKSHFFAELLIEECLAQRGMLAVCVREIQKSLKDSSKRLIEVKLRQLGLGEADGFKVFEKQIQTPGDGVIIFTGLHDSTAERIKSLEGFRRAWVEEARTEGLGKFRGEGKSQVLGVGWWGVSNPPTTQHPAPAPFPRPSTPDTSPQ